MRVALDVAHLPLRNPVVLAGSVAGLDLLTGGRVELGLGAGGFWDAVEAAGGRRLTPGRRSTRSSRRSRSSVACGPTRGACASRVSTTARRGLHAGPAPAHPVGIWVGAYEPRMLGVTGRLADGWLPSMGYAAPDTLGPMNARIDEVALGAGRTPDAVRRLYNVSGSFGAGGRHLRGTPADWAEQLAAITLEHGMSTYILASDDPDDVRRFGEEVAPAVRDLVATERERRSVGPRDRTADAGPPPAPPETPAPPGTPAPAAQAAPPRGAAGPLVVPTPDDGTRLTGELSWDEASRPTYPVRPDPGEQAAYDAHQLAVPQHLVEVHDHLRAGARAAP